MKKVIGYTLLYHSSHQDTYHVTMLWSRIISVRSITLFSGLGSRGHVHTALLLYIAFSVV